MTDNTNTDCLGWKNVPTWAVYNFLSQRRHKIAAQCLVLNGDSDTPGSKARKLKRYVRHACAIPAYMLPVTRTLLTFAFDVVDWPSLVAALIADATQPVLPDDPAPDDPGVEATV